MDAAKSAVNKILHRGGQHDTHVDETVQPAVTQETVKPTRHENITQAVDKEVHQDHYHTTVQPIEHREVLPEQHQHQQLPVQEKEYRHGDNSHVDRSVAAEAAQFKDTTRTADTTHTQTQAPTVAGEHVHHHVHENVQPVIHKETVAPEVVHTIAPVYERHQAPSEHHGMSVLPTKTLDEVKNIGQSLTGGTHREEHYQGHPRKYEESMQLGRADVDKNPGQHDGLHGTDSTGRTNIGSTTNTTGASSLGGAADRVAGHHGRDIASGTADRSAIHDTNTEDSSTRLEGNNSTTGYNNQHNDSSSNKILSTITSNTHDHHQTSTSTTPSDNFQHRDQTSHSGHGLTNQTHHGTEVDNVDRNTSSDVGHHGGPPSRDPALVEERGDKKLTGSGVDGSHSALFGLTPDGHKHEDTSHGTSKLKPAHSKDVSGSHAGSSADREQRHLAEQMQDARVSEKAHGENTSDTGTGKPGAGMTGGSQGFGTIRPEQHGTTSKVENKLDPTTDADGDGKKGVMD